MAERTIWVLGCATYALLLLGGYVHSTGSSLACPDWPTCFGTYFPELSGGVLYEHSHRVLGAVVALGVSWLAFLTRSRWGGRSLVHRAALIGVGLVAVQVLLGGATVLWRLPPVVSTAHLATGSALFALIGWIGTKAPAEPGRPPSGHSSRLVLATLVAVYAQLVLGGIVRHSGASFACPDLLLCDGTLWPASTLSRLHWVHRVCAVALALLVTYTALRTARQIPRPRVLLLSRLALALVAVQIGLGLWTVRSGMRPEIATAHLGAAELLLLVWAMLHGVVGGRERLQLPRPAQVIQLRAGRALSP